MATPFIDSDGELSFKPEKGCRWAGPVCRHGAAKLAEVDPSSARSHVLELQSRQLTARLGRLLNGSLDGLFNGIIAIARLAKQNFLGFVSVVGLVVTAIGAIEPFLVLSRIVRLFVVNWREWTNAFWNNLADFFHIAIAKDAATVLTHTAFVVMVGVSTNRRFAHVMRSVTSALGRGDLGVLRAPADHDHENRFLLFGASYAMILFSTIVGMARNLRVATDGPALGLWALLSEALTTKPVSFVAASLGILFGMWVTHNISHRLYLVERFHMFWLFLSLTLVLNWIAVRSDAILEFVKKV